MINRTLGYAIKKFPIIKYACVGGIAFAVDWGVLYITTDFFQLHYLLGATIGFMCGLVINYTLSIFWAFSNRSVTSRHVELIIFTVIGMVGLLLNDILLFLLTEQLEIKYLKSKLIATGIVFFWNYFARKYSLFSEKKSQIGGILDAR